MSYDSSQYYNIEFNPQLYSLIPSNLIPYPTNYTLKYLTQPLKFQIVPTIKKDMHSPTIFCLAFSLSIRNEHTIENLSWTLKKNQRCPWIVPAMSLIIS